MSKMMHTYHMNEDQAKLIYELAKNQVYALNNWINSAIENDELDRAKELVAELREYERITTRFNVDLQREIAKQTGNEPAHQHVV